MKINLICSECFRPLDYGTKYDKLQGVVIEVDYCRTCIKDKELINNSGFQEDNNWKETKAKYEKGDMVKVKNMNNSDLIYEILDEPETTDGENWTYVIEDTLFSFRYFDVPETNIVKKVSVS